MEERKDRWEKIQHTFKNFNLIRINAIKRKKGAIGCFLSHLECIKIAKEKGLKNIFVIEDDCIPYYTETNFNERLTNIKNILDVYDEWDIFLGGPNTVFSHDVINSVCIENENFVKTQKGYTTHMICYNYKCYDFFLNIEPYSGIPVDKCWHEKLTAIIPVPFIAAQDEGYSNIVCLAKSYEGRTKSSNISLLKYLNDQN